LVTINNLMVIFIGYSLVQAIGMVWVLLEKQTYFLHPLKHSKFVSISKM
jgi:hypothetical protein